MQAISKLIRMAGEASKSCVVLLNEICNELEEISGQIDDEKTSTKILQVLGPRPLLSYCKFIARRASKCVLHNIGNYFEAKVNKIQT
jgi:hypothetical protein